METRQMKLIDGSTYTIELSTKQLQDHFNNTSNCTIEILHQFNELSWYSEYLTKDDKVILDLGGNIGLFAHRAEMRGASQVISFEPVTPTFNCLIKNIGPKTLVYKNAVGGKNGFMTFRIHTDFTHIGGGTSNDSTVNQKSIIHSERVIVVGINEIFENIGTKIDFMKIDVEGGEVDVLSSITDENLSTLRCLSAEFHILDNTYETFQDYFITRMEKLGFKYFNLYHGNGFLRTLTFWKK